MIQPRAGDQTAEIQDALDAGGPVELAPGVYRASGLRLPKFPVVAGLRGAGRRSTVLRPNRGEPIFAGTDYRSVMCRVSGLTLEAPRQGVDAPAVELRGCNGALWEEIDLVGPWAVGFLFDSSRHCYGNTIRRLSCTECVGPRVVVGTRNGGDLSTNPNLHLIEDLWVYGVRGCERVLDLADSTQFLVSFGLIESVPGAVALVPGNQTVAEKLWVEAVEAPILVERRSVTPNHLVLRDCTFWPFRPIEVPASVRGWKVEGLAAVTALRQAPEAAR